MPQEKDKTPRFEQKNEHLELPSFFSSYEPLVSLLPIALICFELSYGINDKPVATIQIGKVETIGYDYSRPYAVSQWRE